MKKQVLFIFICLTLYQTFFADSGKCRAENAVPDTLSWTWEVSSTVSTQTKTCTLEFSDNLLISWGDGVTEWIPDSLCSKPITHVYSVQANYSCTAIGVGISYLKLDSRRVLSLDVRKALHLTYLSCTSNQLSSLDLSRNNLLASLYCGSNSLKTLPLSKNVLLQTLTCSGNQLTELDLSMLPALKKVTCHTNPLVKIGIAPTGALGYLSCSNCSLTAESLDSIFVALPTLALVSVSKNLYLLNNPGSSSCHSEIAAAKNWTLDRVITQSSFYVPSVTCKTADSVQVNVCLKNTAPAIAFEMDILIPDGFQLDTLRSGLSVARKGGHLLSIARISVLAQLYKIMAYSMKTKDSFSGTDGSVLNLYFKAPVEIKTYTLDIQKAMLLDTLTNSMDLSVTDGQIHVAATSMTGDANGDAKVDVTDVVHLVAWINGRRHAGVDSTAMDADGNGVWNIADITKLVVLINVGESASKAVVVRSMIKPVNSLSLYSAKEVAGGNHLFVRQSSEDLASLELCLDNADTVQAFQVDLILPAGLSLREGLFSESSQNTYRGAGHFINISKVTENSYRLLSYALRPDAAFSGSSGVLALLPLEGVKTLSYGVYPVTLERQVLTGMNLTSVASTPYDAVVTVKPEADVAEPITFGSDGKSGIWVKGRAISSFSVWDLTGRLLHQKVLKGVDYYRVPVGEGVYLVKASSGDKAASFQKMAVK